MGRKSPAAIVNKSAGEEFLIVASREALSFAYFALFKPPGMPRGKPNRIARRAMHARFD
jgi:hypothetical protein